MSESKTLDNSIKWLEKRNLILIHMVLKCGFGALSLEKAVERIIEIVRKHDDD